jgi:hypothetical protein
MKGTFATRATTLHRSSGSTASLRDFGFLGLEHYLIVECSSGRQAI